MSGKVSACLGRLVHVWEGSACLGRLVHVWEG